MLWEGGSWRWVGVHALGGGGGLKRLGWPYNPGWGKGTELQLLWLCSEPQEDSRGVCATCCVRGGMHVRVCVCMCVVWGGHACLCVCGCVHGVCVCVCVCGCP